VEFTASSKEHQPPDFLHNTAQDSKI